MPSATLQAVRRLSYITGLSGLPSPDRVVHVHQRKQLFGPLETLVGTTFHGRDKELAELGLHVGVLTAPRVGARLRYAGRAALRFSRVEHQPPPMIHGPGGIGKSTLLAKFVLDHADAHADVRIPFVYIDFERPTLSGLEPATLVVEAARQLAIQYPAAAAGRREVEDAAAQEATRQRHAQLELEELEKVSAAKATVHRDLGQAQHADNLRHERRLIHRLIAAMREAVAQDTTTRDAIPLLLVLDSFEEAQYRSSPYLRRMWSMFDAVQDAYPRVRVVVSGRVPVDELAVNTRLARYLPLQEFDRAAAVGFLAAHGISDPHAGRVLAERFGGSPLSLKLAARLTLDAGLRTDWVTQIRTRRWLFATIDTALIQR